MEKEIDTDFYSRQIKTYGIDTMKKLQNIRILIVGMRGLGIEISKNIILSGVNEVKIFDENICQINDLGSNFYISEKDIGKPRDISCLKKLKELNSYVKIDIFRGNIEEKINEFDAIIITEIMNLKSLFSINEKCHIKNVCFIYCLNFGLSGFIFSDFGKCHRITDPFGKEKKIFFIKNIDKNGIITIDQRNREIFSLKTGDFVKFKEVEGIPELNDGNPRKIQYISNNSFKIEELYEFENYKVGGVIEEVILTKEINYKKLKDCFYIPYVENEPEINDYAKEGRNELLHCAILAIHEYYSEKNILPELNNKNQGEEILKIAKIIYENSVKKDEKWIKNIEYFDEKIIMNVIRWSKSEISPLCSFFGGIAAQEIIKITGKYIPINQWIWFDFFESVQDLDDNINRNISGTRYDDQIAIFGQDFQKKLNDINLFIIGAGALGCEFIKIFSLLGVSIGKDSKTIITDNDLIETSNLNRQFLFKKKDIGKPKSKIVCEQGKLINRDFKCENLELYVNNESEEIFNENFWKKQNFILTAVDSKSARRYIDNQCVKYSKILIDSGTLGTMGSCQVIVPFKTSCYNDNQEIPEYSIPMCTLHNFPSKIEHCIEWGLNKFTEFFTKPIEELKTFVTDKESYFNLISNEETTPVQISIMKETKNLLNIIEENSFDKIIKAAVYLYYDCFDYQINKLLFQFPKDYKNEDNSLFWSGSKRIPNIKKFNIGEKDCFYFIKYYSIILARSINVHINDDNNYITNIAKNIELPAFIPPTNTIPCREEELKEISYLKEYLNNYDLSKLNADKIIPEYFEKDNNSNSHVLFVNICTNLRAENYRIPKSDEQKTKMIAGRIVPAIASTTAMITGFSTMQLLTMINSEEITLVKNCYFDTSNNLYQINNPADVIHIEDEEFNEIFNGPSIAVPPGWTVWDIIIINGPMTCQNFVDYFKKTYNVNILSISSNLKIIIQMFMPSKKKKLPINIEEIYENNFGKKILENHLWLDVSGEINNINVCMPKIKYIFK